MFRTVKNQCCLINRKKHVIKRTALERNFELQRSCTVNFPSIMQCTLSIRLSLPCKAHCVIPIHYVVMLNYNQAELCCQVHPVHKSGRKIYICLHNFSKRFGKWSCVVNTVFFLFLKNYWLTVKFIVWQHSHFTICWRNQILFSLNITCNTCINK